MRINLQVITIFYKKDCVFKKCLYLCIIIIKTNKMGKIKCISGYEDTIQLEVRNDIDCIILGVNEDDNFSQIMLGKKEVQELIDQLEELKKDIL